jgi:hypothetical protein
MAKDKSQQEVLDELIDRYVVIAHGDPQGLSIVISTYLRTGWKLHGPLLVQQGIDPSSPTLVGLIYIQALTKD